MSPRNMAATAPLVHSPSGERIGNVTFPAEFQEIGSLCTATEVAIGGRMVVGIADHRDLHAGLDVGRDHTTWIKARIEEYGFVEGRDYEKTEGLSSPVSGSAKARPQKVYVYRLTLHMAKELAMVEGNDKGKLARRYFIWAEENAQRATPPALDLSNPDHLLPLLEQYASDKKRLAAQVEEMRPAVAALDRLATLTDGSMCITDAAKDLQTRRSDLIRFLEQKRWIYHRVGGSRRHVAYQDKIQAGCLEHKLVPIPDGDGSTRMTEQVLITPKGRAKLAKMLGIG